MKQIQRIKPILCEDLGKVFKDLVAININPTDNFKTCQDKFYKVMRKWGIKQGTWNDYGGRSVNNPEWQMCWDTFRAHKILSLDMWMSLSNVPKDLLAYGKKPKIKK